MKPQKQMKSLATNAAIVLAAVFCCYGATAFASDRSDNLKELDDMKKRFIEPTKESCRDVKEISLGIAENLSRRLKVSVRSIRLVSTSWRGESCQIKIDTPVGIKDCNSFLLLRGDDGVVRATGLIITNNMLLDVYADAGCYPSL